MSETNDSLYTTLHEGTYECARCGVHFPKDQNHTCWPLSSSTKLTKRLNDAEIQKKVFDDVLKEREKQDEKWGLQDHPDNDPTSWMNNITRNDWLLNRRALDAEIPTAERARFLCQEKFKRFAGHWTPILVEEIAEAVEAIGKDDELRVELVQVAAVAIAWIECIDRRNVK